MLAFGLKNRSMIIRPLELLEEPASFKVKTLLAVPHLSGEQSVGFRVEPGAHPE
jgi:hypothetical protein